MTLVLTGPSSNPALPQITPEALATDINTELATFWLPLTGGTLSQPLTLAAAATDPLHAVTKSYVDTHIPAGGPFLPLAGGVMNGVLTLAAVSVTGSLQAATKAYVDTTAANAGVKTFNTRLGDVVLSSTDVTNALTFTPYNATNPASYVTTAQSNAAIAAAAYVLPTATTTLLGGVKVDGTTITITGGVISGPARTNTTPLVSGTASVGSETTWARGDHVHPREIGDAPNDGSQYVRLNAAWAALVPASATPIVDTGVGSAGASLLYARQDHYHPTDTSRAPLASPDFTGVPLSITPTVGDNTRKIATTAFVAASMSAAGAISEAPNDGQYYSRRNLGWFVSPGGLADAPNDANTYGRGAAIWKGVLPITGGALTGALTLHPASVSTAPNPTAGTSTTQIATTNFVMTSLPVASSTTPLMDSGSGSAGSGTTWAKSDHQHPTDTSRYAASNPSNYVNAAGAAAAAPVQTVATRTGAVVLTHADITDWAATLSPYALLADPIFTGFPQAPTPVVGSNNTVLATTQFVARDFASIASPVFTGNPTAPTPVAGDNDTSIATTAFVTRDFATTAAVATNYAPLVSPVLTGFPQAPTPVAGSNNTVLATTQFVARDFASIASPVFTGNPTAPTPAAGDNDTSIATTQFVTRDFATITSVSTNYAPLFSPVLIGDPKAITASLGDNDTSIATTAFVQRDAAAIANVAVAPAFNGTGRNLIHNPLFNVAQRGAGPWSSSLYTLDRWKLVIVSDTIAVQQSQYNDTQRATIGDEQANNNFFVTSLTGNAAAGAFSVLVQPIENVRRLAGKTVTVSFWAHAGVAGIKLGVSFDQIFGSGGSPSTTASMNGQAVTLTTNPTRYSLTFNIPSISGKVLGTNGDDNTGLDFWFSSGATNNTRAGGIGVQSGQFVLGGVQLEIGSVATPLEKPDPRYDLANCQRFYMTPTFTYGGSITAANVLAYSLSLPVTMRAAPTVFPQFTSQVNLSSPGVSAVDNTIMRVFATGIGTSAFNLAGAFTVSADL